MNKLEIVYYFGVVILTTGVIAIMYFRFREYDEINLENHIFIIIIYILLLIFAIIVWRILFDMLHGIADIININNSIYKKVNI